MLSPQTFTRDWLKTHARATGAQNAQIFERCVRALELVGRLSESGLDFIFKGGKSLILRLEPVRRLSVEVDIARLEPRERVMVVLNQVRTPPFTRWEHQDWRDAENPPASSPHYHRATLPSGSVWRSGASRMPRPAFTGRQRGRSRNCPPAFRFRSSPSATASSASPPSARASSPSSNRKA